MVADLQTEKQLFIAHPVRDKHITGLHQNQTGGHR